MPHVELAEEQVGQCEVMQQEAFVATTSLMSGASGPLLLLWWHFDFVHHGDASDVWARPLTAPDKMYIHVISQE